MKVLLANKFFHLNGGSETVFFQERDFLLEQGHAGIDFSMMDERNISSLNANFLETREHNTLCTIFFKLNIHSTTRLDLVSLFRLILLGSLILCKLNVLILFGVSEANKREAYNPLNPTYTVFKESEVDSH